MKNIYNLALVLHIIGISIVAGTTFIDYLTYNQFWKVLSSNRQSAIVTINLVQRLQRFISIGMLLIVVAGIAMIILLPGVWPQQIWFRVKMVMLLLVIINGFAIKRRLTNKLNGLLSDTIMDNTSGFAKLKSSISLSNSIQLLLILVIFVLSAFKFN